MKHEVREPVVNYFVQADEHVKHAAYFARSWLNISRVSHASHILTDLTTHSASLYV
ncbi:MAG: hypothetical protein KF685_11230 [Acidobacteria bacterium]|nr:hypothetical protein [Acidobacteriota bacterium]